MGLFPVIVPDCSVRVFRVMSGDRSIAVQTERLTMAVQSRPSRQNQNHWHQAVVRYRPG